MYLQVQVPYKIPHLQPTVSKNKISISIWSSNSIHNIRLAFELSETTITGTASPCSRSVTGPSTDESFLFLAPYVRMPELAPRQETLYKCVFFEFVYVYVYIYVYVYVYIYVNVRICVCVFSVCISDS